MPLEAVIGQHAQPWALLCLIPASPAVKAASTNQENEYDDDDQRRAIHDVNSFERDGLSPGVAASSGR
jgi:hypothetical protein